MGKSGHIAHKIAATLASTGSPAFFLHPGEAGHGDIGMITRGDVLLALSNSGETPEVMALLPPLKRLAMPLIALTGNAASTLARAADVHLDVGVPQEACPHNLAPTASTTAALVMGDALAVALLEARGFSADDFARTHPGGSLGRRLLLHVEDIMRRGDASAACRRGHAARRGAAGDEPQRPRHDRGAGRATAGHRNIYRRRPAPCARSKGRRAQRHDAGRHDPRRPQHRRARARRGCRAS